MLCPEPRAARPTAEQVVQASTQIRAATDVLKELAPPESAATSSGTRRPRRDRARPCGRQPLAGGGAGQICRHDEPGGRTCGGNGSGSGRKYSDRSIRDLATAARLCRERMDLRRTRSLVRWRREMRGWPRSGPTGVGSIEIALAARAGGNGKRTAEPCEGTGRSPASRCRSKERTGRRQRACR